MRTYVLAMNHRHFVQWCYENKVNPRSTAVYVDSPRNLYGIGNVWRIVFDKTWRNHPKGYEIALEVDRLLALGGAECGLLSSGNRRLNAP